MGRDVLEGSDDVGVLLFHSGCGSNHIGVGRSNRIGGACCAGEMGRVVGLGVLQFKVVYDRIKLKEGKNGRFRR